MKSNRSKVKTLMTFILSIMLLANAAVFALDKHTLPLDSPYANYEQTKILKDQIKWIDLSDTSYVDIENSTQSGNNTSFKVGTKIIVYPMTDAQGKVDKSSYKVIFEVTNLQPFNASEIYKKRTGSTNTKYRHGYDPNAQNNKPVIVGNIDGTYANLATANFGVPAGHKGAITTAHKGNVGITFKVSAETKKNGKWITSRPNIVVADAEEANDYEFIAFVTEGSKWELLANITNVMNRQGQKQTATRTNPIKVITTDNFNSNNKKVLPILKDNLEYWLSSDKTNAGLGTEIFGPVTTPFYSGKNMNGVPILLTRAPESISLYINDTGMQSMILGVMQVDEGDAPEYEEGNYGEASHSVLKTANMTHPYLGSQAPDYEVHNKSEIIKNWFTDDLNNLGNNPDEGEKQLIGSNNGGKYSIRNTSKGYKIAVQANSNSTNKNAFVRGFADFNNDGDFDDEHESSAIITLSKGTQMQTAALAFENANQILWNDNPYYQKTGKNPIKIGVRVRIARTKHDINKPFGVAYSGEVEDFLIPLEYNPEGKKIVTKKGRGKVQYSDLNQFNPDNKHYIKNNDQKFAETYGDNNAVDQGSIRIIDPETNQAVTKYVDDDGNIYTVLGTNGKEVIGNGRGVKIKFTPNPDYVGETTGVDVRFTDHNGNDTSWIKQGETKNHDGHYSPIVYDVIGTKKATIDIQGKVQSDEVSFTSQKVLGALAQSELEYTSNDGQVGKTKENLDKSTAADLSGYDLTNEEKQKYTDKPMITAYGEDGTEAGKYIIIEEPAQDTDTKFVEKILFVPEKNFTGKVKPLVVTLHNDEFTDLKATSTYTPEVVAVTPTGKELYSSNFKNITQEADLDFTPGDQTVPMNENYYFKDANGSPTTTTQAAIDIDNSNKPAGYYEIEGDKVKFVPATDYIGTPKPIMIYDKDENGTEAHDTYHPTVIDSKIAPHNAVSKNIQGKEQKGTPTFTTTGSAIGVPIPTEDIKNYELVNHDDDDATKLTVPGKGVFTLGDDGEITFKPERTYTGQEDEADRPYAKLKITTKDDDTATAEYHPTVVPVKPLGHTVKTIAGKGVTQNSAKDIGVTFEDDPSKNIAANTDLPELFTPGSAEINGETITIALEPITMKLINDKGEKVNTLIVKDEHGNIEGTYSTDLTDANDYKVIFTPEADFVGEPPAVKVMMEDKLGTEAYALYEPKVVDNTPKKNITVSTVFTPNKDGDTVPTDKQDGKVSLELNSGDTAQWSAPDAPAGEKTEKFFNVPVKDKDGNIINYLPVDETYLPDGKHEDPNLVVSARVDENDPNHIIVEVKPAVKEKTDVFVRTKLNPQVPEEKKNGQLTVILIDGSKKTFPVNADYQKEFTDLIKYDKHGEEIPYDIDEVIYTINGKQDPSLTVDWQKDKDKHFTVKIAPKGIKTGSIIVNYVDKAGNKIAEPTRPDEYQNVPVGTDYETTPKLIDDYTLVKTPTNATGTIAEGDTTVKYIYKKTPVDPEPVEKGTVIIKHIVKDEDGNVISETTENLTGDVGTDYQTKPDPDKAKDHDVTVTGDPENGQFSITDKEVIYTYVKKNVNFDPPPIDPIPVDPEPVDPTPIEKGTVTVKHIVKDNDGNVISETTEKLTGNVGEDYQTKPDPEKAKNHTVIITGDPEQGTFSDKDKKVIYTVRGKRLVD